ncbi:MAG: DNA polymerase III subunit delta [Clostridiales bacterium]|nr:DNA polymerase III subunit delta [Clostridiales bacterium]
MNYLEVIKKSKTRSLESLYVMINREAYLYDHTIERIKSDYLNPELYVFNFGYYDGISSNYDQIVNGILTLPVMSEHKIQVIENLDQMNLSDEQIEKLIEVSHHAIGCVNIFTFNNKMSKAYKLFKKKKIEIVEFEKLSENDFKKWVVKKFNEYGKKISNQSLDFFINYSMYNDRNQTISLYQMENEIKKITSLPYEFIEIEHLKEIMVMPLEMNIFALTDYLVEGNIQMSMQKLDELMKKGHNSYEILPLMTKQYHNMLLAKILHLKGHPLDSIQEILAFKSSYPVKLILKRTSKMSRGYLMEALGKCIDYEIISKSEGVNKRAHVESLFINLTMSK